MTIKHIILLLFLLTGYASGHAQQQFRKPLKASSGFSSVNGKNYLGIKAGTTWSVLSKNDLEKNSYLGHWGYHVGFSGEHIFNQFSLGFDVCWTQRGTMMRRQSIFQISLNQEGSLTKEISAVYDVASISIPVTYYLGHMNQGKRFTPYLYLAPSIDLPLPYCLRWDEKQQKLVSSDPILTTMTHISTGSSSSNTQVISSRFDAGVSAGIGLMMAIQAGGADFHLKLSAGCRQGLINLATDSLKEQGVVILNQSLEASVTFLFQLKRPLHDACYSFRKQ